MLAQLESSAHAKGGKYRTAGKYLLSSLLHTPSGEPWHGDGTGKRYRVYLADGKSRYVSRPALEQAVLRQVVADLTSEIFIRALLKKVRSLREAIPTDPTTALRERMSELNRQITRAMTLAVQLENPDPALALVNDLERERTALANEVARLEQDQHQHQTLVLMNEASIRRFLEGLAKTFEDGEDRGAVKDALAALIETIVYDPEQHHAEITYRIDVGGSNLMASPRGHTDWGIEVIRLTRVA